MDGCFSWITCDTRKAVKIGRNKSVYVLIPEKFGGGSIREGCYEGYGKFGGHDMYDLVADWNKEYATVDNLRKPKRSEWGNDSDSEEFFERAMDWYKERCQRLNDFKILSDEDMKEKYGEDYKRSIGIDIACYNDQNAALKYPIKIAERKNSVYETCEPSLSDPDQGM